MTEPSGSPEDLLREIETSLALESSTADFTVPIRAHAATVAFNIEPEAIPIKTLRPNVVISKIAEEYSSRLNMSSILALIPPDARPNLSEEAALAISLANDRSVVFEGGWLRLDTLDRVTPIAQFGFGEQNLSAAVSGSTEEAEYLCKRMLLLLWHSAEIERKWSEFEELVEITSYRTSTVVDMGLPLSNLLHPSLTDFLKSEVEEPGTFGSEMGTFASKKERVSSDPIAVAHCREIDIRVSLFDGVSGDHEECLVNILLHSRTDANRSRVKFMTELPSQKHREMVTALVKAMAPSPPGP